MGEQRKGLRNVLALLLAGSMFVTAGCGSGGEPEEGPVVRTQEEETEASGGPEFSDGQKVPDGGQAPGSVPQIRFSRETADDYDNQSGQWLLHVEYETAEVTDGGTEEAAQAVRQWSEHRVREIEGLRKGHALAAAEDAAFGEPTDSYRYSITQRLETARVDARVISLIESNSEYTGGAHGSWGSSGVTFDAESGALLELEDLLTDQEGFQETAEAYILGRLAEREPEGLFPDYESIVSGMWESGPNWYLDAAGITFIFQPYLIGPWAMGEVLVTFPYTEAAGYLSEDYLPERLYSLSAPMAAKVPEGETVQIYASPLDSSPEKIRVWLDGGEEGYGPVRVEADGVTAETESFVRIGNIFLMCPQDGRTFLVFDADYASDDFVTFVFELKDRLLVECDRREGLSIDTVNTDSLKGRMHLDMLGTYGGQMDYTPGPDGQLEASGSWYEIPEAGSPWQELHVVRELPVRIGEEETTLPAGSVIRITAADNEGTVRFRELSTGLEGEITGERGTGGEDSWKLYIDGIPEDEYFETLPYAG